MIKSTKINLNNKNYIIYQRGNEKVGIYSLICEKIKLVATGDTLKEALLNFIDYQKDNNFNLVKLDEAFKNSKYYNHNGDYVSDYNKFINNIEPEILFDLVKNDKYENYILWNNVHNYIYICKECNEVFSFDEYNHDELEKVLWEHIQLNHEEKNEELQYFDTSNMIDECYKLTKE